VSDPTYVLDMPEAEYHAHPALSSTGVRSLLKCPERYRSDLEHGRPPKDAFDLGSVVHGAVLGTGWPLAVWDGDWTDTGARAFRDEARSSGQTPIKGEQLAGVEAIKRRVLFDRWAGPLLDRPGLPEISLFWIDPETGVRCRARLDMLTETDDGRPLYVEVKTTRNATRHALQRHVAEFGYHMQQEWNLDGLIHTGLDPYADAVCKFVFVETTRPYPVVVVNLDDQAAAFGRDANRRGLRLYQRCVESGDWPSYVNNEITVGLPRWAQFQEDE